MEQTINKTFSELKNILIQIENKESNVRAAKAYIDANKLTKEEWTNNVDYAISEQGTVEELKARYNELLATLKPF